MEASLPGSKEEMFTSKYSPELIQIFIVCQWFEFVLCICILGWVIRNIWVILFKKGKYKVLPLLTFYILAILLVILRMYDAIFNFYEDFKN